MPSISRENELPRLPIQSAEKRNSSGDFAITIPAMDKAIVRMEDNKAQLLTDLSFFIKNDNKPLSNGTKKSNKTSI